jgi:hypothetical protein
VLILDHLLISNSPNDGTVSGGFLEPANPEDKDSVTTLTLLTPGGHLIVRGDAALSLFEHYKRDGRDITRDKNYVMISRLAVETLKSYFEKREPDANDHRLSACIGVVRSLVSRL